MTNNTSPISTCSNCKFFQPQGRCRGICDRLDTVVSGNWSICRMGMPALN